MSSVVLILEESGLLFPNIGLPAQTSANAYIGNYASSNYNALLTTLRKRFSNGLQFDFNYTYSHSIDNVSDVANNYVLYSFSGNGLVCELDSPRVCRASSDFDARHTFNVNYIYDLPVGQGRHFLRNAPGWLNAIVGGWGTSSIITWRTGYPFTVHTGSFPTAFTLDAPAALVNAGGLKQNIHTDSAGELQYFASQPSAVAAFAFPFGGGTGTRNAVRGPGFSSVDMAIEKTIKLPRFESQHLKLRMDTFNTFNHPVFNGQARLRYSTRASSESLHQRLAPRACCRFPCGTSFSGRLILQKRGRLRFSLPFYFGRCGRGVCSTQALVARVGVGIERYGDLQGRLGGGWREFPLHYRFLRAFREDGITAKDLRISYGTIRLDEDFQANESSDTLGLQN